MRIWILICVAVCFLCIPVHAETVTEDMADVLQTDLLKDGLTDAQKSLMGDLEPLDSPDFFQAMMDLFSKALLQTGGMVRHAVGQAASVLAVCLLCGLCGTAERSAPVNTVVTAGVLAILTICAGHVQGMIRTGADTLQQLVAYAQLQLPVMAAASVSAGAAVSAPAIYSLTVLFADVLLTLVTRLLMPLLYAFLAMAMVNCMMSNSMLKRMKDMIGWLIRTGLKTILYVFTGFLTLTQVISGSADAMTTKAAKLTISGMVPVVGSIISDASETVLVGASMIRSSVGVFGMLAVLSICILPFLQIGISYLITKLTAAVSGMVAQDSLVASVDALAETMGMLLAMTGAGALLLLISTVCSLKAVGY